MKKLILMSFWVILATLIAGCSSYQVSTSPQFQSDQIWAIMPMTNNSNTPLAAEKAEQILNSLLFSEGIKVIQYPAMQQEDLASILDDSAKQKQAQEWLQLQDVKYVITGSIEEWQYKSGVDGEPAAGISLQILDKQTQETLWRSSGSRAGWGRESLSATGQIVIKKLLSQLDLNY